MIYPKSETWQVAVSRGTGEGWDRDRGPGWERRPEPHETKDSDRWSPELLAATATIITAVLVQYHQTFSFLPSGSMVGVAAAITVVAAVVLNGLLHSLPRWGQFVITLFATLLIMVGVGLVAQWRNTSPGRNAFNEAAGWPSLPLPSAPLGERISAGVTKYGTGYGVYYGDYIEIHIDSTGSNLITWYPTKSVSPNYYAQVEARQTGGSAATACALVFAFKSSKNLFHLALRADGLQLAYWDGAIPARAYEGPTPVSYATNLDNWHTIGVLVEGSQVTAFVDDRQVFSDYIPGSLSGGVTFGTLDIGSGYDDDATCQFRHWLLRAQGTG
jgi:hypothetical protein